MPIQGATTGASAVSGAAGSGAAAGGASTDAFANSAATTIFDMLFKIIMTEVQKGGEA